jgi:GrpB-like predicted nucleotidyltransferase (UPF0157 family)
MVRFATNRRPKTVVNVNRDQPLFQRQLTTGRWIKYRAAPMDGGGYANVCREITVWRAREVENRQARHAAEVANTARSNFLAMMPTPKPSSSCIKRVIEDKNPSG